MAGPKSTIEDETMTIVWRGKRPLQRKTGMNKTEAAYALRLEWQKQSGEILDYRYEAIKLRLADKTFYTPDFFVVCPDHMEIHEVKGGFYREAARVRFNVAAEQFPWFRFILARYVKKEWVIEEL
jgi:hypothetical protein